MIRGIFLLARNPIFSEGAGGFGASRRTCRSYGSGMRMEYGQFGELPRITEVFTDPSGPVHVSYYSDGRRGQVGRRQAFDALVHLVFQGEG